MELSDSGLLAVEVKSSTSVKEKTWSNLLRFKERFSLDPPGVMGVP